MNFVVLSSRANVDRFKADGSSPTFLDQQIGRDKLVFHDVASVAKFAHKRGRKIREVVSTQVRAPRDLA